VSNAPLGPLFGMLATMRARGITPILNVSDMDASFAWFEKLGWRRLWDYDDPPTFGAVGNGDCEMFLCLNGQGQQVWISIWVDDVDEVHRACQSHGFDVPMPPTDEPWNVREMHVRHPDGHVFRISRPLLPDDHHHDHPHPHDHDHPHPHE
jgi:predicted enzyme related to lactoylglutathione lyase